ncbi:MAG: sensor histidine kinase [Puniceicoccales bacterium]
MKFRPIILAWLLLLGATLAMGAGAWWLLGREADRVEALAEGALASGAATVAENVDLLAEEIKLSVSDGLLTARNTPQPRGSLAELVANNPYVRAGLYFRGVDGVTAWYGARGNLPPPSEMGPEETFPWQVKEMKKAAVKDSVGSADYSSIFKQENRSLEKVSTRQRQAAPTDIVEEAVLAEPVAAVSAPSITRGYRADMEPNAEAESELETQSSQNLAVQQRAIVSKLKRDVQASLYANAINTAQANEALTATGQLESGFAGESDQLAISDTDIFDEFAANVPAEPAMPPQQAIQFYNAELAPPRQGWAQVDVDGQRQWLNWIDTASGEDYLGAWLDRAALVAELAKALSISRQDGVRYALVDGAGRVVAGKRGLMYSSRGYEPAVTLPVGASLPGWRIEAYASNGYNPFGRSFRLLGGLTVTGLSLAILLGGSLLLWQAQRDAREAQRKTTFVANVSHELKTPLTSIRMFAEMLAEGRVGDETKRQRYLQTMLNETQRLTRLVNNVLDFSRLERGKRDFQHETLDLGATVESILEGHRERLASDGLAVTFIPPVAPLHAKADRDAIEQILLNLLDNAVKYAAAGERAEVRLQGASPSWKLSVCDFGPGIPARERRQVFESFHRVDDRLTAERPGCGLGLSIAARLAEGLGGQLSLSENKPTGCCFTLTVTNNG